METGILAQVSRASLLLAQASTAIEAKRVADMAKAAEVFATKQKSEEAKHHAHCIYLDALRLEGQFLKTHPKADGGDAQRTRLLKVTESPKTLKQQEISKQESVLAQRVYDLSEKRPEAFQSIRSGELTLTEARRLERRQESSDIRAHVAVYAKTLFVFPTVCAVRVMEKYPLKPAFQNGVNGKTAEGHCVVPSEIEGLRRLRISDERLVGFDEGLSTTDKGNRAVDIVSAFLKSAAFSTTGSEHNSDTLNAS